MFFEPVEIVLVSADEEEEEEEGEEDDARFTFHLPGSSCAHFFSLILGKVSKSKDPRPDSL